MLFSVLNLFHRSGMACNTKEYLVRVPVFVAAIGLNLIPTAHQVPPAMAMESRNAAASPSLDAIDEVSWRGFPEVVSSVALLSQRYDTAVYGTPEEIRSPQEDRNTANPESLRFAPSYFVPK
jgi:hypothetical protein